MKSTTLGLFVAALAVSPAYAAHNNPWATEGDVVVGKNHDANQERSIDTPGEDEMRGHMNQNVSPNAGTSGHATGGASVGAGEDAGGHGHGGRGPAR